MLTLLVVIVIACLALYGIGMMIVLTVWAWPAKVPKEQRNQMLKAAKEQRRMLKAAKLR